MSRIFTLTRSLMIPLPIHETFSFFEDAGNLERITPEFLGFQILTEPPLEMRRGLKIDYEIRLFGIPMKWKTLIESYDPPRSFVDTQLAGPYKYWHHSHDFRAMGHETQMTDTVRYQIGFGPFGEAARILFIKKTLDNIFDYRNEKIQQILAPAESAFRS